MSESNVLDQINNRDTVAPEHCLEARLRLDIPGEITGVGPTGSLFVERIMIGDMNEIGCRLETRVHPECGDIVEVNVVADRFRRARKAWRMSNHS